MRIHKTPFHPEAKEDADFVFQNDPSHQYKVIDDVPEMPTNLFDDHESILLTLAYAARIAPTKEEVEEPKNSIPLPVNVHVVAVKGCSSVIPIFEENDSTSFLEEMVRNSLGYQEETALFVKNGKKFKDGIYFETNTCRTHYMRGREFKKSNRDSRSTILRHEGKRKLRKVVLLEKGKLS